MSKSAKSDLTPKRVKTKKDPGQMESPSSDRDRMETSTESDTEPAMEGSEDLLSLSRDSLRILIGMISDALNRACAAQEQVNRLLAEREREGNIIREEVVDQTRRQLAAEVEAATALATPCIDDLHTAQGLTLAARIIRGEATVARAREGER